MNEAEMSEVEMIAKLKAVLKACEETHRFSKHSRHFFKVGEWLLAFEHIYSFVEGNEEFRRSVEQNYEPLLRLFHRFRNFDTLPISKW